jgi:hypothetical protein
MALRILSGNQATPGQPEQLGTLDQVHIQSDVAK